MTETMKLETEAEAMRNVLAWYEEKARLARLNHSEGDPGRWALAEDGGKRAREVLAAALAPQVKDTPPPSPHLRGEPTGYLVKRYDLNGVLLDTELSFTKPVIRSTAKTEFVPLYADLATTEGSTE